MVFFFGILAPGRPRREEAGEAPAKSDFFGDPPPAACERLTYTDLERLHEERERPAGRRER